MKTKIFFPVMFACAIGTAFYFSNREIHSQKIHAEGGGYAEEENLKERLKWELKRLVDPLTGKIPYHIRQKELTFAKTLPTDMNVSRSGGRSTNYTWTQRGPWNVGGRTRAIAIDVTNENIMIAGSVSGGIWRTDDGGASWTMVSTETQTLGITSVVQDKRSGKTNIWYAGTGESTGASASGDYAYYLGNGIYKSTDNGLTWVLLPSTTSNTPQTYESYFDLIWNIALDNSDTTTDEIYAATTWGEIYRSANGGTSWSTVLGDGNSYYDDIAITSTGVLYATLSSDGTDKGIWRSTDGVTWVKITPAGFPGTYNRIVIGIAPSDENQVYFLGETPGSGKITFGYDGDTLWHSLWRYTYLSGDGSGSGGSWEDRSANIPSTAPGKFDNFDTQGGYDMTVRVHPADTDVVFIAGTNIFRSTNQFKDGVNTTKIGGYKIGTALPNVESYPNHHSDQHDIIFLPSDPDVMFSASDGGIAVTSDALASSVSWVSLNNGYISSQFYTIGLDHATPNSNIIIGGLQDNGTQFVNSPYEQQGWTHAWGGDGSYLAVADGAPFYYVSIQLGKTYKVQLDASGNKTAWARIDPIGGKNYQFINPFVMDPNNNNIMYLAGGNRLWRNDDLSAVPFNNTWDSIATNWVSFPDTLVGMNIASLSISTNPPNRLYIGTDKRRVSRIDNANAGTPAKVDITPTSPAFPTNGYVSCIAIDPRDADKIMVVFSNYSVYSIFYSQDGGGTWIKAAGNLEQFISGGGNGPSCRWAAIMPEDSGRTTYFVAASTGFYAADTLIGTATTSSTVWVQQGAGEIGNAVVDMIDFRASDKAVVIGTHGYGVFSANMLTIPGAGIAQHTMDARFSITGYPNPFSQSAHIDFTIPTRVRVKMKVYDISGKEIANLADREFTAGKHSLSFDGSNLSDGIYYCVVDMDTHIFSAGDFRKTLKMVKVR